MSWKEQILDKMFKDIKHYYEDNGVLHFGFDSTGKPGKWSAHPFCGKRLRKWIGFGEVNLSKTDVVCPKCAMLYFAQQSLKEVSVNQKSIKEAKE